MNGKVVLVTGASSGVGVHASELFAAEGADVALLARGREGLERVAERVHAHGRRALVLPADVTDRAAMDAAVATTVAELGGLDVAVSCAAATVHGPFADVTPEEFDRAFDVTFTGMVNLVRASLPELERRDGVVVAVGSLAGKVPLPTFSSYSAAKHAQRGFLNTLRVELLAERSPVRVAQLHPGLIDTPLWDQTGRELPRRPPEGYDPEQVAAAVVGLALKPRPERTFGAEAKAVEVLWRTARPAGDLVLGLLDRYFSTGTRGRPEADVLHESAGDGTAQRTLPVRRPSLARLLGR